MTHQPINLCYAPEKRAHLVPLTDKELELVNLIRSDKGLGPVFVRAVVQAQLT